MGTIYAHPRFYEKNLIKLLGYQPSLFICGQKLVGSSAGSGDLLTPNGSTSRLQLLR